MNNKFRYSGFTLIELTITMSISSVVLLGMFYIFMHVSNIFTREIAINKIVKYGNTVLDVIADEVRSAENVEFVEEEGTCEITINSDNQETIYWADKEKGIYDNSYSPQYPLNVNPDSKHFYTIENFLCDYSNDRSLSFDLRNSIIDLTMEIKLQFDKDEKPYELFSFTREIFSHNGFID